MKIAFLFPGQGSQAVGMGKSLYDAFSKAKEVFQEVDDALNESLSKLMFEGPLETLSLTHNTQPALMAVSMAVFRMFPKTESAFFAGHSLGEYSAHAALGTFSLKDTAQLLRIRGLAMQDAVPVGVGGMSALIGAGGIEKANALCDAVSTKEAFCSVANDNSSEQIVISGHKVALDLIPEKVAEFGFRRAIPLSVSAPFHCALMQPAAEKMTEAFCSKIQHQSNIGHLIANVTARPLESQEFVIPSLVEQITARVRWRETMNYLVEQGVSHFIEVGSGKVLSGLVKRAFPEVKVYSVEHPEDVDGVIKEVF
jgi:[acyl-carrier-protein] S-malonyltransferase